MHCSIQSTLFRRITSLSLCAWYHTRVKTHSVKTSPGQYILELGPPSSLCVGVSSLQASGLIRNAEYDFRVRGLLNGEGLSKGEFILFSDKYIKTAGVWVGEGDCLIFVCSTCRHAEEWVSKKTFTYLSSDFHTYKKQLSVIAEHNLRSVHMHSGTDIVNC